VLDREIDVIVVFVQIAVDRPAILLPLFPGAINCAYQAHGCAFRARPFWNRPPVSDQEFEWLAGGGDGDGNGQGFEAIQGLGEKNALRIVSIREIRGQKVFPFRLLVSILLPKFL